jgi:hypothetical protein
MEVDPETDNARIGYQAAISMAGLEGNLVWTRYGLMLLAHTIILSAVGLASNASQPAKGLIWFGLSLVGLVLCALWWIVNDVGFRYFFYWIFAARELEEGYLAPVKLIGRGFPVADEGDSPLVVGGKALRLQISKKDRRHVVGVSKLIIVIFGVLYAALLVSFLVNIL